VFKPGDRTISHLGFDNQNTVGIRIEASVNCGVDVLFGDGFD